MGVPQLRAVRRALPLLLSALVVTAALSVLTGAGASAGIAVDRRLDQRECALTGRVWVPSSAGCARHRCVKGATFVPFPPVFQRTIVFVGGVGIPAGNADAATAYLAFLTGADTGNAYSAHCLPRG